MKIKVCGVTRAEDAALACELGAWAVGLIFAPKSPRLVSLAQAKEVREKIAGALAVGVFSGASREDILRAVSECALDAVQLHGDLSPAECAGFPVPVIKVFNDAAPALEDYDVFAALLEPARTDADRAAGRKPAPEAQRRMWDAAAALQARGRLVILAGGLTPGNVAEAVRRARPDAVDVSGGVESSFGVKDPKKLRGFFKALS